MPAGTVVSSGALVSPGGQQGIPGPNAVSTDAGNQATFGSDSRIYVPDPTPIITAVRLRSFNSIGNPNFECLQRNVGALLTNPASLTPIEDRWLVFKSGSSTSNVDYQAVGLAFGSAILVPGTSFPITKSYMRLTNKAVVATPVAGEYVGLQQTIEGHVFRELSNDVHALSLLVRSSVANLKFGVILRDPGATQSLPKLCQLGAANTFVLTPLPSLPAFPSARNFSISQGQVGYTLAIVVACGSGWLPPANDAWQTGNFVGALGQDSFCAQSIGSTFDVAFVQHQSGSQCSQLIDIDLPTNLFACQRYFCKNFPYNVKPAANTGQYQNIGQWASGTTIRFNARFPRELAKTPTNVSTWGVSAGPNSLWVDGVGADFGASVLTATTVGLQGATLSSTPGGATFWQAVLANYAADTGW